MNSANSGNGNAGNKNVSDRDLTTRLGKLGEEIEKRSLRTESTNAGTGKSSSGYSEAMKISSEFIAGIAVGGLIGWVVDKWLETSPFGLVVFLLLGFAAGILNVIRATGTSTTDTTKDKEKS